MGEPEPNLKMTKVIEIEVSLVKKVEYKPAIEVDSPSFKPLLDTIFAFASGHRTSFIWLGCVFCHTNAKGSCQKILSPKLCSRNS